MKIKALIILIQFPLWLSSQTNNELGVSVGYSLNTIIRTDELIGGPGFIADNSLLYGIHFRTSLNSNFKLEAGVNYLATKITVVPAPMFPPIPNRIEPYKLVTLPIGLSYYLTSYLYFDGGILFDIQTSSKTFSDQSGIGIQLGAGIQYPIEMVELYLHPYYHFHGFQSFNNKGINNRLTAEGINIGVRIKLN